MKARHALLVLPLLLAACSQTAWEAHAYAALTLRDVSNGSREVLREAHMDVIRGAATSVARGGEEPETDWNDRRLDALTAADAQWRRDNEALIGLQRGAAEASNAYSLAAFKAIQGEGGSLGSLVEIGRAALRALVHFAQAARAEGLDIPVVPAEILSFLGDGDE